VKRIGMIVEFIGIGIAVGTAVTSYVIHEPMYGVWGGFIGLAGCVTGFTMRHFSK